MTMLGMLRSLDNKGEGVPPERTLLPLCNFPLLVPSEGQSLLHISKLNHTSNWEKKLLHLHLKKKVKGQLKGNEYNQPNTS